MKFFIICCIVCILGVQGVWCQRNNLNDFPRPATPDQTKVYIQECAEELNVPVYKNDAIYAALEIFSYFYPGPKNDKMACMRTCLLRKHLDPTGQTVYQVMLSLIDLEYNNGIGSSKVSSQEMKSKVEYCHQKELSECEFYKCLDVMKPPLLYLATPMLKSLFAF